MTATTEYRLPSDQSAIGNQKSAILKGWVVATYRTYNGKKLGPYYFRKWKVGCRTRKQYIKPQDVERVKAACQAHRERKKQLVEGGRRCAIFIDNADFLGRMCLRYDKGKEVTTEQEEYIVRLTQEGMHITGRPLYRPRRVFGSPFSLNFGNAPPVASKPYMPPQKSSQTTTSSA